MKLLCVDTSTANLSVALSDNDKVIIYKNVMMKKVMSSAIVPTIDKMLRKVQWQIKDVDGFIVGIGPGSFTSLRVGLATIKGFAFAFNKPVVGLSSLDVLAAAVKTTQEQICVLTDAKRQNIYSAVYDRVCGKIVRVSEYGLGAVDDVIESLKGDVVITGDAIGIYQDEMIKRLKTKKVKVRFTDAPLWNPQAKFLPLLGSEALAMQPKSDLSSLLPMYLYPDDCQVRR